MNLQVDIIGIHTRIRTDLDRTAGNRVEKRQDFYEEIKTTDRHPNSKTDIRSAEGMEEGEDKVRRSIAG